MALFKYFERSTLPHPNGPLSRRLPPSTISFVNKEINSLLENSKSSSPTTRGSYCVYTDDEKFLIGKRAAEMGVTSTIRHFKEKFSDRPLKESTVRTWKNKYVDELKEAKEKGGKVEKLSSRSRGHPLLLGKELDNQVQAYIKSLGDAGAVINSAITIGVAEGIIKKQHSSLLACNGGYISLTKTWALSILKRMGYVKRRASTKAKVPVAEFESHKALFLNDIKSIMIMDEVPPELVINWDHTGINYVPVSNWTMAKQGSKRIEIFGKDDKRQITAVFAGTMSGDFLFPQILYAGKTSRCLPSVQYPKGWHVTYTENRWANEKTTADYINLILLPYIEKKRTELSLALTQPALVIFDRFKGQCTDSILRLLDENNVRFVIVPANCTDRLQPLDVSVNKPAKEHLRQQFQSWYSDQVQSHLEQKEDGTKTSMPPVSVQMSVMKPLGVRWIVSLFEYMKSKPELIVNGFRESGILAA